MHTLIPGTEWPMTQMVYPKGRASDIRLNTDAFDGTILPQEPGTNGTKPVFLDQRMDESTMNIMPAAEAADVQSMEQSQKAEFDIDSFAQKVYWILKRQLVVEKERRGVKF